MERVHEILKKIEEQSHMPLSTEKHEKLASLWTEYYQLCKARGSYPMEGENLYFTNEDSSFILMTDSPKMKYDQENLLRALEKIENRENKRKLSFTEEEANALLDWSVCHARKSLISLGINVESSSLNGLCELGQALTLYPFLHSKFPISINNASLSFDFPGNHAFGTVTIPTQRGKQVKRVPHLIDITYRQFFTTLRCNEGIYDSLPNQKNWKAVPDPGYFMTSINDQAFAKHLIKNGHMELTKETSRIYANGFRKASLTKEELEKQDFSLYDEMCFILDLSLNHIPLEEEEFHQIGINTCFPSSFAIKTLHLKK